jgi:hypothetical protein
MGFSVSGVLRSMNKEEVAEVQQNPESADESSEKVDLSVSSSEDQNGVAAEDQTNEYD